MRIGVSALLACLAVATAVAAVMLVAMPWIANDRPSELRGVGVTAAGPSRADPTPPPATADPIDTMPDEDLVSSENRFLTVDLVVVSGLWLIIACSVGWIVVRLVRGGQF